MDGATRAHSGCKLGEQLVCLIPVDAGVGDALAVESERLACGRAFCAPATRLLSIMTPMMFAVAGGDLGGDIAADDGLARVVLRLLLAWLQSIMMRGWRPAFSISRDVSATDSARVVDRSCGRRAG